MITSRTPDFEPPIGLSLKDDGRTVTLALGQVRSISYANEASGSRFQNFRFRAAAAGRATLGFARRGGASTMPVRYTVVGR